MLRAYKFRIYPNQTQQRQLRLEFAAGKFVYNYYLDYSKKLYETEKKSTNYYDWHKDLTFMKKIEENNWLNSAQSQILSESLRDLQSAFKNFFRNVKQGKKSKNELGYPKFKEFNSSCRYPNNSCKYNRNNHKIWISKCGWINIKDYTNAYGKLMNITISKSKDIKWYASICVEQPDKEYINNSESQIGIDVGIKSYLADSNGNIIENPKFYVKNERKRKRLSRSLSRKKIGSNNRKKAKLALAKFDAKISAQRNDFLNQLSTDLVKNNKLIAHEDLAIKNMMHHKKGHKNRLAKHIGDASWGEFFRKLQYKGVWYNCKIVRINRFAPSTKTCNHCGNVNHEITLKDREWVCSKCGNSLDRDVNAAKNILEFALKDNNK